MAIRFLCQQHRDQLANYKDTGSECWQQWMTAGRRAYAERNWQEALRFLGSSFELSELVLDGQSTPALDDLDRFMVSGHFLSECFVRCGDRALQRHCLLAVHYRLLQALRRPSGKLLPLKHNVEISLHMLERAYRADNRLDELAHCQRESRRLVARCYH